MPQTTVTYWPTTEAIDTDAAKVWRALQTIQALAAGLDIERLINYRAAVEHGFYSEEIES